MSALPVSGLAAIEAGNLVRKLEGATQAEVVTIVDELRVLLAKDGSSLFGLGMRIMSPRPRLVYYRSGVSKFGDIVWPDDLRQEAIKVFEEHVWEFVRTPEDQRKVDGILAALKSRAGRMTRAQADCAERVVRIVKGERP